MPEIGTEFLEFAKQSGSLDDFCENWDGDKEECEIAIADSIQEDPVETEQGPDMPEETPEPEPQDERRRFEDEMQVIVSDCVGKTRFGFARPNEHACHRMIEKMSRKIDEAVQVGDPAR